jgi:serine/threonine protein kinase
MGSVYEVIQDSIGHRAAMKVLPPGLAKDPKHRKYVERFLDEARAVNLINHAGVLQIFDFGEMEDQTVYILMEYIDGKPLGDFLQAFRQGDTPRMPIFQIMQIAR